MPYINMGNYISNKQIDEFEQFDRFVYDKKLVDKLNDCGIDGIKMIELVKKYKLALCGSFILQIISGEKFIDYDIDIICHNITSKLLNDFNKIAKKINCSNIKSNDSYQNICLDKIYNFIVTNKIGVSYKIQLITINQSFKTFIKNCDLSIVKNYYDGNSYYVHDMDCINKKIAIYNNYDNIFNSIRDPSFKKERIEKYNKRGYTTVCINTLYANNY